MATGTGLPRVLNSGVVSEKAPPATSQQPRTDSDSRAPPTGLWMLLGPILHPQGQELGRAPRL